MELNRQLHAPANRNPDTPLYRRLGDSQSRPGFHGEEEDLIFVLEIEPKFLRCLDHSPITILTEPSQHRKKIYLMNYGVKSLHEMNILGLIISKLMNVISLVN
jgi:hypothetical protein